MRKITYETILMLEPSLAPQGDYFNSGTPNRDRENQFFEGWYNEMTPWGYRNQDSHLRVAFDDVIGAKVLEWKIMHVRYLLTTDQFWSDGRVSAKLRITTDECVRYHDIPGCTESRLGIVFRYEDHRHFYFFAMEGLRRFVLYRRDDDEWGVLAEQLVAIDPERYYNMTVEAIGSGFRCMCEDAEVSLAATDSDYPRGRFGIRGNSLGKIASAKVAMTPGQKYYNNTLKANYDRELAREREKYPRMVPARRLDISDFGPVSVEFVNLRNTPYPDMLLTRSEGGRIKITAVDLDLNVRWERDKPLTDGKYVVYRDAPDGHRELITVLGNHFEVINLATGETVAEPPFPRPIKHKLWVLASGMADSPGNVRGTETPGDILIRYCDAGAHVESEERLMVMDDEFNEIWSVDSEPPGLGHTHGAQFFDVDGDGRDEVFGCYQLLSPEGKTIWTMRESDDILGRAGAGHIDFAVMGNFAGDAELDPTIFICSGGVYVVDGLTGRCRSAHRTGHTQGGKIGNFRPDLPGLELAGRNRWGSMGVVNFINGRGVWLSRMHPDPIGHPGGPINWSGDGQELVYIGSYRGFGLYDGHGKKVVELPAEWCNESNYRNRPAIMFANVLGDPRQEIIHFWQGVLTIYTQDRPASNPERVYNPIHRGIVSLSSWSQGQSVP